MDPSQFDAFSRTLADGVSRRQAVARFGAAGLLAGLTSALGRNRTAAALPALQADTCRLAIVATIRLGPSAGVILEGNVPGELRGELSFALGPDGAIDSGRLRLEGGAEFAVVGQADGRALHLRVDIAPDQTIILVGTAAQRLDQCTGDVDGLLTGPGVGDLGDWHATATALGAGGDSQPGATATPGPAPAAPPATSTPPPGAPTATAAAPATATATATETPTPVPTETPTPAPTETPVPEPPTPTPEPPTPTPEPPTPTPEVCPTGTTDCGGICVDLLIEPANCGACGNVCPQGTSCQGGACTCLTECCVDDDCNGCEACQNGACIGGCPSGWSCCGGGCVDTETDFANRGGCGDACSLNTADACVAGDCVCGVDPECTGGAVCLPGGCGT